MSDIIDRANEQAEWHRQMAVENRLNNHKPTLSAVFIEQDGETIQLCAECDEQIPAARLRVLPEAVLCIECQEKWEKHL